jgi:hypothetical protein
MNTTTNYKIVAIDLLSKGKNELNSYSEFGHATEQITKMYTDYCTLHNLNQDLLQEQIEIMTYTDEIKKIEYTVEF